MRLVITSKNLEVTDWLRSYLDKKTRKFSKYLEEAAEMRVELAVEPARSANQRQVVQVTCSNNGTVIRSQERSADMTAAIDLVVDKLDRQIKRNKDKRVSKKRHPRLKASSVERTRQTEPTSGESTILRVKRFRTVPMSADEAVEQMENLGHTFFGFFNRESGELNVVYKRQDGTYGRLEYEKG